ncbi:MAG: thimet oligopeptidase [Patescibacteria group bacterium]|jgi:thimet oligopeptidase|nr:thimet oligopeptidase [Patescibacteria group bacterium]
MKIIPKTQKDFEWINWSPEDIKKNLEMVFEKTKQDLEKIKSIPKKDRNFLNTIYAYEKAGQLDSGIDSIFAEVLFYVSSNKEQREAGKKYFTEISEKMTDLIYDKDLYRAFKEYNPKKEKLSTAEKELYRDQNDFYKKAGFQLSEEKQKELKNIIKEQISLGSKFSSNLNNFKKQILCTEKDLDGLSSEYVNSLHKDEKTGKYIVDTSYPVYRPFMRFAKSDKKRKELADLNSLKGGKENIKILEKLFELRNKQAKILGYKNYSEFVLSDRMSKSPQNVRIILEESLKKIKPKYLESEKLIDSYKASITGKKGDKTTYYDASYYSELYKKEKYNLDDQKIKEYFELNHVLDQMFNMFGSLFSISFLQNKELKLWHEDLMIYDLVEKNKKIGILILDMFPRDGKYSHMCSWGIMPGYYLDYPKNKNYAMPVSTIIGNFPKGQNGNPSLLSRDEVRTLFHEFGHSCHSLLTRATFESQSGTDTDFDFVETPSQLFENWFNDLGLMKKISKHYKTGESVSEEIVGSIKSLREDFNAEKYHYTMLLGVLDLDYHYGKKIKDLMGYAKKIFKKYGMRDSSPKSLFPASWGHMVGYASSYYAYSISLIYSYDIFSRFEESGLLNKKVGKELRDKVLSKGGSMDEFEYMKDFLGRKPNNKAFLKALGIKK